LALHGPEIGEQIANVITRPERYRGLVAEVRAALRENHSYDVRVGQLTRALAGEA
jgi:hypothetical protein